MCDSPSWRYVRIFSGIILRVQGLVVRDALVINSVLVPLERCGSFW